MHDGRAPTLEEAIKFHGGQAAAAAGRFAKLSKPEQRQLLGFLETLRAPDVETVAHLRLEGQEQLPDTLLL